MAALDGMALLGDGDAPIAGGAFVLNHASQADGTHVLDGTWTTEIRQGSRCVVARGPALSTHNQALEQSLQAAQRGLDVFSIRGIENLRTQAIEDEHLVWWVEAQRVTLRLVSVATTTATIPPARMIVHDAAGNEVPDPPQSPLPWHDSFRYFRLAQVTDDLFDAYRNLYLALEALLSTIVPLNQGESETNWLRRAFREVANNGMVDFAAVLPNHGGDPVQETFQDIYLDKRNAIFHAKNHRTHLVPHDPDQRQELLASHKRLTQIILALVEGYFGVRRFSSGMFAGWFRLQSNHLDTGSTIYVSDDPAPFDPSDEVVNPSDGNLVALDTRAAPELDQPFVKWMRGTIPVVELAALTRLARTALTNGDTPYLCAILEGHLTLQGIHMLEVLMGLRLKNFHQPKGLYST
jgi:methylamine utilization protein MauJ